MTDFEIEDRVVETTSGLTSVNQLVDMTNAVSFDLTNSSSAIIEGIFIIPQNEELQECEKRNEKKDFKKTLRRSIRETKVALDLLEKL